MKTLKFAAVLMTALATTFTLTSCLGDSDSSNYADISNVPVTVNTSSFYGTTFYADLGCTFVPTSASLQNYDFSKVKRALVSMSLLDENASAYNLEEGKSYNVSVTYAVGIPTIDVADRYNNEAADSLATTQTGISSISSSTFYVANGYVTTQLTVPYGSDTYSMAVVYDSSTDVDTQNNTLSLDLQYNHNSQYVSGTGSSVFSFKLPTGIASRFTADSVTVSLRALSASGTDNYLTAKTKAALSDLVTRSSY
jgi:hypothetical protein